MLPGYQATDKNRFGGKPVSAATRSFRAAGDFLKKEKKRSDSRIQQEKTSDMKNLRKKSKRNQKEIKRDIAR